MGLGNCPGLPNSSDLNRKFCVKRMIESDRGICCACNKHLEQEKKKAVHLIIRNSAHTVRLESETAENDAKLILETEKHSKCLERIAEKRKYLDEKGADTIRKLRHLSRLRRLPTPSIIDALLDNKEDSEHAEPPPAQRTPVQQPARKSGVYGLNDLQKSLPTESVRDRTYAAALARQVQPSEDNVATMTDEQQEAVLAQLAAGI